MEFTERQKELVRRLKADDLARINILYGSVRSGKTWITLIVFALWIAGQPQDKSYLMCGKTLTTLKRNCLDILQDMVGEEYFRYSITGKVASLFGRRIYLEGANDIQSEGKIRGLTLQGAYCDEITLLDRGFFTMLLSRLSEKGAKLFGSTNPDRPSHWLKKEYIDRQGELDIHVEQFHIDDNTFLAPEYIRAIKAEYTGVFYKRFIEGDFALAEGLIYPMYEKAIVDEIPAGIVAERCVSIDYGTLNAFAAMYWQRIGKVWYCSKGYYYSGRNKGVQKTDGEYLADIERWLGDDKDRIRDGMREKLEVIIDPSAASFIALLRKTEWAKVRKAHNDVLDGIRETAHAMQAGRIKISATLTEWAEEMAGYVWKGQEGKDEPVKENDHYCDATRYMVYTKRVMQRERYGEDSGL